MKIILTTLNSKYIHSSLALRSIASYCNEYREYVKIIEFTINNHEDYILGELVKESPDVICFSCYIWNIKMTLELISSVKKILKDVYIIIGGPEVTYDSMELMLQNKSIDINVLGEGEQTFRELLDYYIKKNINLDKIKGIIYRNSNGELCTTSMRSFLNLNDIPFVYKGGLLQLQNKIIYYESQRGCPFRCIYCLSSNDTLVRTLSLDRVCLELKFFLNNKISQCKFVDRTFNQNIDRAISIWQFIIDNDNNITNFHFEIAADILNDEAISLLSKARKGLFQFEIGIQSTNIKTLEAIKRKTDFNKIKQNIIKLSKSENIHIHLDLIAGLPFEDYISFGNSFNDVYKLNPSHLQLGFLKLLKGCEIRNKNFNITYKEYPPYEVISTDKLSYNDIAALKIIEDIVDKYYNSGKSVTTLKYVIPFFDSPFAFYEALSKYWINNNYHAVNHSKIGLYDILFQFCNEYLSSNINIISDLLKFDMLLNDNIKNFPRWVFEYDKNTLNEKIRQFIRNNNTLLHLKNKNLVQLGKTCNISLFSFDILKWLKNYDKPIDMTQIAILFDYTVKDEIKKHAKFYMVY